jgi:hypothetical protein
MADSNISGEVDRSKAVPPKYKIILYVGAWIAALFATDPSGGFWSLVYMFPLGLAAFINVHWGNDGGWGVLAACVAIYVIHGYFYFRSRTKRSTLLLFAILVILLVCNVSGCHKMFPGH